MIDFSQLDKLIHEKGRLSILTLLASRIEPWAFQDLKSQLDMSDGNLITHLRTLEKVDFIGGEKLTGDGRPKRSTHSLPPVAKPSLPTSASSKKSSTSANKSPREKKPKISLAPNALCDAK